MRQQWNLDGHETPGDSAHSQPAAHKYSNSNHTLTIRKIRISLRGWLCLSWKIARSNIFHCSRVTSTSTSCSIFPLLQHRDIGQTKGTDDMKNKKSPLFLWTEVFIYSCYGRVSGDFICGSWGSMTTKRDDYNLVHDRLSERRPKSVPEMKGTSNCTTIRVIYDLEQFIHMNMAAPNWNWTSQYLLLLWIRLYLCAQATEEVGERFLEFNFDWITLKTIKGTCKKRYKIRITKGLDLWPLT